MRAIHNHELAGISGGLYIFEEPIYSFNDVQWMHEEARIDGWHSAILTGGVAMTVFLSNDASFATVFWGTIAMSSLGYNFGYQSSDVWDLYW